MIVVDSNVWIYAENQTSVEHAAAVQAVRKAIDENFGINPIVVSEVFHALCRLLGPAEAVARVSNILRHPSGEWLLISTATTQAAMALSAHAGIRINDALIATQALEQEASVLTDDVRDFRKVKGLKVVALR
ncbi:MAG: type II toxin-antitoxin system VapC family toxin [Candidatus Aenigmarchaeota archaeon]|nr:type II toxin-antitoxin system VapC family toxin [Candidatus Aenigmarchaeota archaeon]